MLGINDLLLIGVDWVVLRFGKPLHHVGIDGSPASGARTSSQQPDRPGMLNGYAG
jgi:hypothetical protein